VTVRLDRKARIAVFAALLLMAGGPLMAIRNCVSIVQNGDRPVIAGHAVNDGLLRLKNGATVFLQDRALSRQFTAWLQLDSNAKSALEIADSNFARDSAEPTSAGRARIAQVAQVLNADPQLRAQITLANGAVDSVESERLDQSRAARVYEELLAQDVPASKVAAVTQSASAVSVDPVGIESGQRSHLVVVLSR
jgi:outer membrane protein OmpA-like peptidoglycan-associated protein